MTSHLRIRNPGWPRWRPKKLLKHVLNLTKNPSISESSGLVTEKGTWPSQLLYADICSVQFFIYKPLK